MIFVFSLNHKNLSLEQRECISFSKEELEILSDEIKMSNIFDEFVILSTCNRFEFYGVVDNLECAIDFLKTIFINKKSTCIEDKMLILESEQALAHLFCVATGLESQIVGETEILSQVKNAYKNSSSHNFTDKILNKVFQKAFQYAKWARTNTDICKGQVSIGNVISSLCTRIFDELNSCKVLMFGAGQVAEKTLEALISRGAKNTTIASKTFENAKNLSAKFNSNVLDFETAKDSLNKFDIIITALRAEEIVFDYERVKNVLCKNNNEKMFFIVDLAVPRNVDENVCKLENIYLYNLDDISKISNDNLKSRMLWANKCREILNEKASLVFKKL